MTLRLKGSLRKIVDVVMDGEYHIVYRQSGRDEQFRQLRPTWTEWYADPILYTDSSRQSYVFMEVYDRINDVGHIGISEFKNGILQRPVIIIAEPFHMSFPLVFNYKGEVYMIPETIAGGGLRIYRMKGNIYEWENVRIIDEIRGCVDTVILVGDDDSIDIFTCEENKEDRLQTRLRRYRLQHGIDGKCRDVSNTLGECAVQYRYDTRNGGPFIKDGNKIYRVVQKSTEYIYGESIDIREALITDDHYSEQSVKSLSVADIKASTMPLTTHQTGVHTYGRDNGIEIADLFVARASLSNTVRKLYKHMKKKK